MEQAAVRISLYLGVMKGILWANENLQVPSTEKQLRTAAPLVNHC